MVKRIIVNHRISPHLRITPSNKPPPRKSFMQISPPSNKLPWDLIQGKHDCRIISYSRKPHRNSYKVLLPLTGDKKTERNVTFVMKEKKSLLTYNFVCEIAFCNFYFSSLRKLCYRLRQPLRKTQKLETSHPHRTSPLLK